MGAAQVLLQTAVASSEDERPKLDARTEKQLQVMLTNAATNNRATPLVTELTETLADLRAQHGEVRLLELSAQVHAALETAVVLLRRRLNQGSSFSRGPASPWQQFAGC